MGSFVPSWFRIRIPNPDPHTDHWPDRIRIRIRNTAYMVEYRYRSNAASPQLEVTVARRWAASPSHPSFNHSIDHVPARPLSICSASKVLIGADWLLSECNRIFIRLKLINHSFVSVYLPPPPPPHSAWEYSKKTVRTVSWLVHFDHLDPIRIPQLKSVVFLTCRVADPRHFNADRDPAFHFNADPNPALH